MQKSLVMNEGFLHILPRNLLIKKGALDVN